MIKERETTVLNAILVIECNPEEAPSAGFWRSALSPLRFEILGKTSERTVLRIQYYDLQACSMVLPMIREKLAENFRRAIWLQLSGENFSLQPESEKGMVEYYSLPAISA